jgi:anti-sigma B factor antagonist
MCSLEQWMDRNDSVQITQQGPVAIVAFGVTSITDAQVIAAASKRLRDTLAAGHPARVVFDFHGVTFFSSQVLGLLLETRARLQAGGGKVLISAVHPSLHRVFKTTNLDKIFEFFPSKADAVKAAGASD